MANDMSRAPRFPLSRSNPRAEPDARGYEPRYAPQPDPRQYQPPVYQPPSYQPPEPPRAAITDPLSELARLIGDTKPFDEPRQPIHDRSSGWPGQPPAYSPGLPPLMPEYRNDLPALPPTPDPRYAPPAPPRYGQQHPDYRQDHYKAPEYGHQPQGPYYGDDGRLMPQDPYEAGHYDFGEPRRRGGGIVIAGAVAGLVLLGLGGAYAYRTMVGGGVSGPPPLIKAETGPSKIVPAQTGADGAGGKQIYDRVGSGAAQDERVVSREEQPVDVRTAARPALPNAGTLTPQTALSNALNPPQATAQSNPVGSQNSPRPVKTIPIRPDAQGNTAPPQRTAAAQPQNVPAPSLNRAAAPVSNAPLSLTPGGTTIAARAPATAPAEASAAASAPTGVGYMVQVSAQKTQAEATSAFKSAQAKMPNLLGTYQVVLRKKEIPHKGTFYGAQVGPFETRSDADGLCAQIKSAGGNCLVEKN